jgi:hypothetical protein
MEQMSYKEWSKVYAAPRIASSFERIERGTTPVWQVDNVDANN